MIRFQSIGGKQPHLIAVFVCDICGERIAKIKDGAVVFRDEGTGGGELLDLMHVHKDNVKGNCQKKAEVRLTPQGKSSSPWDELADHLNGLDMGMGVTIKDMINKQVNWTGALAIDQHNELQEHITKVGEFLREHGKSSPLWEEPQSPGW